MLFGDGFEHVGGWGGGLGDLAGYQEVALQLAVLLEEGADLGEERGLGGMGGEGFEFLVGDGADVEGEGPGGGEGAEAAGEEEVGGDVVEALRGVERAEGGEALGRAGPVEGGGGGGGDGGVVGVSVGAAVHAEGEDDVGADVADAGDKFGGHLGEVGELEFAVEVEVGVVEELVVVDVEDGAGGGELGAAEMAEFGGGLGGAAIGAGGAFGEADDAGFDAALGGEGEGSAEGKAFVVGVGDDAEEAKGQVGLSGGGGCRVGGF
jgi:hypothetical protein